MRRQLTGDLMFNKVVAHVCSIWASSLEKQGRSSVADRLAVLQPGLKHDDVNLGLFDQVGSLAIQGNDDQAE